MFENDYCPYCGYEIEPGEVKWHSIWALQVKNTI